MGNRGLLGSVGLQGVPGKQGPRGSKGKKGYVGLMVNEPQYFFLSISLSAYIFICIFYIDMDLCA